MRAVQKHNPPAIAPQEISSSPSARTNARYSCTRLPGGDRGLEDRLQDIEDEPTLRGCGDTSSCPAGPVHAEHALLEVVHLIGCPWTSEGQRGHVIVEAIYTLER